MSAIVDYFMKISLPIPDRFRCALTNQVVENPKASARCTHVFEEAALEKYQQLHDLCPKNMCGKKIEPIDVPEKFLEQVRQEIKTARASKLLACIKAGLIVGGATGVFSIKSAYGGLFGQIRNVCGFASVNLNMCAFPILCFSTYVAITGFTRDKTAGKVNAFMIGAFASSCWLSGTILDYAVHGLCENDNFMPYSACASAAVLAYCSFLSLKIHLCPSEIQ
jgi:hypothetical protein